MKESPILFSTPMVKAILEGSKTQTRRIKGLNSFNENPESWKLKNLFYHQDLGLQAFFLPTSEDHGWYGARYPFGKVGDLLWVRETWAHLPHFILNGKTRQHVDYKANPMFPAGPYKWKPSIHMRKEHSRIWLEVVEIKIERLFAISEADARAEGVERWPSGLRTHPMMYQNYRNPVKPWGFNPNANLAATQSFLDLWESIHGSESVNSNPWVWVISFKVLSTTGRPAIADQEAATL